MVAAIQREEMLRKSLYVETCEREQWREMSKWRNVANRFCSSSISCRSRRRY